MAKINGKITGIKLNAIEDLGNSLAKKTKQYDIGMERNMTLATNMVWRIAHQKRPYISKEQQKLGFRTKSGNVHHNRVSDPNAQLGVPVDTGRLQAAIKKEVKRNGQHKWQGMVYVDGVPYAKDMEFGTSKVHARPFMRPAAAILTTQVKALFKLKATVL